MFDDLKEMCFTKSGNCKVAAFSIYGIIKANNMNCVDISKRKEEQ